MLTLITLCLVGTPSVHAASKGGSSGGGAIFSIPVRLSIFAGYHSGSMNYESDRKGDSLGFVGAGADFNVPIPPLHSLVGITGWIVPTADSGEYSKSSILVLGPYLGYASAQTDIFAGAAVGMMATTLREQAATPDSEVHLGIRSGCGFGGIRRYFGKGITTGIGINGYHCVASSYDKTNVSTTQLRTESVVSAEASSSGGFVYLFLAWDESRTLL